MRDRGEGGGALGDGVHVAEHTTRLIESASLSSRAVSYSLSSCRSAAKLLAASRSPRLSLLIVGSIDWPGVAMEQRGVNR